MKGLFVLVSVLINCDKGAAPSCKDAIEKASKVVGLDGVEVTLAVGTCEQKQWSLEARQCVAAATGDDALAACSTKLAIDMPTGFATKLAKLTAFQDQMCACKDADCAQHVKDDMTTWSHEHTAPSLSEEQAKRWNAVAEQLGRCTSKAMTLGPGNGKMPF